MGDSVEVFVGFWVYKLACGNLVDINIHSVFMRELDILNSSQPVPNEILRHSNPVLSPSLRHFNPWDTKA